MSYGIIVANNDNYIQIDSERPRLCAVYNGTYTATDSPLVTVDFPAAITTLEPPCIFLQNSPDQNSLMYTGLRILGSAGSWTGFRLSAMYPDNRPTGKWFVAIFSAATQASYGLRIWDSAGGAVFDSGATPVIVTKASQSWTYPDRVNISVNAWAYRYNNTMVSPIVSDEYFMVNPFSRGMLTSQFYTVSTGIKYDWQANRLQMFAITNSQGVVFNDVGAYAGVFARLPGT